MSVDHPALLLPTTEHPSIRWTGLTGAATALQVARAATLAPGPVLLVTSDAAAAARLEEELAFFCAGAVPIFGFPGYETLPYDQFSPHPDIISQRLRTLARLPALPRGIVIVDLQTVLQRLPPRAFIDGHALSLKAGEALDLEQFRLRLTSAGYASVPQVGEPGDFAIRGSLFDVFPMGSESPLRIDLFDDVIDSIRSFDAESQRSLEKLPRLDLLPAREFSLSPESIKDFRRRFRTRFQGDLTRMPLYRDVGEGLAPAGIEYYLPLFFEQTATLLDYLPARATVILPSEHDAGLRDAWGSLVERHEERRYDIEHPVLDPAEICVPAAEWLSTTTALPHVLIGPMPAIPARPDEPTATTPPLEPDVPVFDFRTQPAPSARIDQRREETLHAFADQLRYTEGRVLLAAESAGRRELLLELLRPYDIAAKVVGNWREFLAADARIALTVAPLASGVTLHDPAVTIYAEEQLFGERARQERRRRRTDRDPAKIIQQLADLRPGAPVVHEDYGVGRYTGLTTMDAGGMTAEFLVLEYAEGDKLYVPVQALERISRYTGAPAESAPLHKLGGDQWTKARARAAAKIRDAAAELLDVYARRAAREGHAFPVDDQQVRVFESGFPFEETVDQLSAIQAVIEDLRSGKPMDRVVCGDVGFGKTEVALRAAFSPCRAASRWRCWCRPRCWRSSTSETFADRFADWPVKIELLSRFHAGSAIEGGARRTRVRQGGHRRRHAPAAAAGRQVPGPRAGHHRRGAPLRGARQGAPQSLRAEVDVLTLTATPIPRTLNMALRRARAISR